MDGKPSWKQEKDAVGYIASTVKKETEMTDDTLIPLFFYST